jgi:hypothetical protein
MRRLRDPRALLGCVLVLLTASTPAQETVRVIETRAVSGEPAASGATHELRLHLYAFQGARWGSGDIVVAVWDAMRMLQQCGVALAGAELRLIDAPRRFHFYATAVSRELASLVKIQKPALFFVDDTHNQPAYDSEAIGRENAGSRPELTDTVWVSYGARDLPLVIAHELVHVLSDSGDHSDDPGNLMYTESSQTNTRLTDAQCRRLRERGEANGLLVRR